MIGTPRTRTRTERGRQMEVPQWVEDDIELLPKDFSGQIVIEVWEGGVTSSTVARLRK